MTTNNTKLTCPDCGGALERVEEAMLIQYRCRVGHLYSPETALAIHAERQENILWSAVVILQEGADLAEEISKLPSTPNAQELRECARSKRELAERVRQIVLEFPSVSSSS